MKGKKRFTIGVLRAIGVCALVGILIGALAFLEKDHSVEPAQIIFAAVSYTHLDVYKRQDRYRRAGDCEL